MIKLRTTVINVVLFVVFMVMSFMIIKCDINKLGGILFVHLSSISLENFKDRALIIPEILELIKLHTYKFGLVYLAYIFCLFEADIPSLYSVCLRQIYLAFILFV